MRLGFKQVKGNNTLVQKKKVAIVATAPSPFTLVRWNCVDKADGTGLLVTIISEPADGGSPITAYGYSINAGAVQTVARSNFTVPIASLTLDTIASIQIYAINAVGTSTGSDVKTQTPTLATAPAAFITSQWTCTDWADGSGLAVTISTEPADGGSPITAYGYSVGAGSVQTVAIGNFTIPIASLTLGTPANIKIYAINAMGTSLGSDIKARTPTTVVIAQTALFGDGTNVPYRPYIGGVPVDITGTPILQSGSAAGYTATVSGGGLYFGTGNGAPAGAVYSCTLAAGGTINITPSVTANARSVNTSAGMQAAVTAMRTASQTTDWTVIMRGATYGTQLTDITFYGKTFSGTVTDSEAALAPENRNLMALATVSGGSVTFKAEVPYAPKLLGCYECLGSGPFVWDQLEFQDFANVDSGNSLTFPALTKVQSHVRYQITSGTNGTYPTLKKNIVRRCKLGSPLTPATRLIMAMSGIHYVEQNYFDGFTIGVGMPKDGVVRSNIFRNFVTDCVRLGFGVTSDSSYYVYGNELYGRNPASEWDNEHGDGIQGGSAGTVGNVTVEIHNNFAFHDDNQGFPYLDDSQAHFRGIIQQNFYLGHHTNALATWAPDDIIVRNNTMIERPDGSVRASSPPSWRITPGIAGRGPMVVGLDNILMGMDNLPGDVGLDSGNYIVGQSGNAYDAVFVGPFTGGTGSPVLAFADTSDATRKATILAAFAVKPAGPAAGKGFQYLHTTYPPLATFDAITNTAPSVVIETAPRTALRGTNLVVTAAVGTEYEIRAADDVTILQAWTSNPGVISKGEKIRKRKMTAGIPLTAVSPQIVVDGTTFTTAITTGLTMPTAHWTTGSGSPNTYFFAPSNMSSGTTRLVGKATFEMPSIHTSQVHLFGCATNAWMFRIETSGQVQIGVKDSGNLTLLSGAILRDSLAAPVVLPTLMALVTVFDVDYTAHTATVTINGITYPPIAFTANGNGTARQMPVIIGAGTVGGSNIAPAGWKFADVSVERNGSVYKILPNDIATLNTDTWKAGAPAV